MKALKTSIIACAALLSLGSCDFLDKEPTITTSGSYFNNESEAESFLNGVYAILHSMATSISISQVATISKHTVVLVVLLLMRV